MTGFSKFASYSLAALAGICFVKGLAFLALSTDRSVN